MPSDFLTLKYSVSLLLVLAVPVLWASRAFLRRRSRLKQIPTHYERVLIIGASSGIGRELALQYAGRGARLCIVARREDEIQKAVAKCNALAPIRNTDRSSHLGGANIYGVHADVSNTEDMIRLRERVETEWQGIDTVIVCAGVSALLPLMEVAGLERTGSAFVPPQATVEGTQRAVNIANAAAKVNYIGPLVSAVTFLPLLQSSSASPSMVLMSSLAAIIPAPTRSIYGSTKAASLMLYQALSIEHPAVRFTHCIPSTVQGDFRASAVDGGAIREVDPNRHGLKIQDVAKRCIQAVDAGEKYVFMPWWYARLGHLVYWLFPGFVEQQARKKYGFTA